MADLSTINTASPAGGDAVSSGDDEIRDLKTMLKTSFHGSDAGTGTQASEHYGKGFHKFPTGNQASRPAAGNAGRLYLNTTDKRLEVDTGAAWALLNAVPLAYAYTAAGATITTLSQATMQTLTLDVPTGARLAVFGSFYISNTPANTIVVECTVDGTALTPQMVFDCDSRSHVLWAVSESPTTGGSITVLVRGITTAASETVTRRALAVVVL